MNTKSPLYDFLLTQIHARQATGELRPRHDGKAWSDEDIQRLRWLAPKYSPRQIALRLYRSEGGIKSKAKALKIPLPIRD